MKLWCYAAREGSKQGLLHYCREIRPPGWMHRSRTGTCQSKTSYKHGDSSVLWLHRTCWWGELIKEKPHHFNPKLAAQTNIPAGTQLSLQSQGEHKHLPSYTTKPHYHRLQPAAAEQKQNILECVHMSTLLSPNTDRQLIVPSPGNKHMRNVTSKITSRRFQQKWELSETKKLPGKYSVNNNNFLFPSLSHTHRQEGRVEH